MATPKRSNGCTVPLLFAISFFACLAMAVFGGKLPPLLFWIYLTASTVTLVVYKLDKMAARYDHRRTPENTLHFLSLLGGWPGAMVAQKLFRHKSQKLSFNIIFWATIILNIVALGYFISSVF